jgi:glutamine cyclotransferase
MDLSVSLRATMKYLLLCLLFAGILSSCNSGQSKSVKTSGSKTPSKRVFRLADPRMDTFLSPNDSLLIQISSIISVQVDSACIFLDGILKHTETKSPLKFYKQGIFTKVGRQTLRVKVFYNDSLSQSMSVRIILLSDKEPEDLAFEPVKKLSHNPNDFIQGLFYHEGFLYEGTGQLTRSRLIKTRPETGEVVMEHKLDDAIFGEGIALVDDKIYQLTYKHKIGFVYQLENFEKIREFELQTMEGWGLTYDGEHLIMSDGSSRLYFIDPLSFTQVKQLDVASNKGLVNNLNELEYRDGFIWANIYGQTHIVKIKALTGEVISRVELISLFPEGIPRNLDHTVNGIAYNPDHDTYYVTGKLWPVMYEIRIVE